MKEIPLTQGQVALIDDEDYDLVSQHHWHAVLSSSGKTYYALTNIVKGGRRTSVMMHKLIMGSDRRKRQVDHQDCDGLNNRRANLRWATRGQQKANQRKRIDNRSGFKGVDFAPGSGRWRARIGHAGGQVCLGLFDSAHEAARAYDAKAKELFGEFARVNFE